MRFFFILVMTISLAQADEICETPFDSTLQKIFDSVNPPEMQCPRTWRNGLLDNFDVRMKTRKKNDLGRLDIRYTKYSALVVDSFKSLPLEEGQFLKVINFPKSAGKGLVKIDLENDQGQKTQLRLGIRQGVIEAYYMTGQELLDGHDLVLECIPKKQPIPRGKIVNKKTKEEITSYCVDEACSKFYFSYKENPQARTEKMISKVINTDDLISKLKLANKKNGSNYTGFYNQVKRDAVPDWALEGDDAGGDAYFMVMTLGMGPILTLAADAVAAPVRAVTDITKGGSNHIIRDATDKDEIRNVKDSRFNKIYKRLSEELN